MAKHSTLKDFIDFENVKIVKFTVVAAIKRLAFGVHKILLVFSVVKFLMKRS